jgi:hypothetical protein
MGRVKVGKFAPLYARRVELIPETASAPLAEGSRQKVYERRTTLWRSSSRMSGPSRITRRYRWRYRPKE